MPGWIILFWYSLHNIHWWIIEWSWNGACFHANDLWDCKRSILWMQDWLKCPFCVGGPSIKNPVVFTFEDQVKWGMKREIPDGRSHFIYQVAIAVEAIINDHNAAGFVADQCVALRHHADHGCAFCHPSCVRKFVANLPCHRSVFWNYQCFWHAAPYAW